MMAERTAVREQRGGYSITSRWAVEACCSSRITGIALKASSRCRDAGYGDDVAWGHALRCDDLRFRGVALLDTVLERLESTLGDEVLPPVGVCRCC